MVAHTLAESQGVWAVVDRLAAGATAARADLLVLPECTYPAYWLQSRDAYEAGGYLDTLQVLRRFGEIARAGGFWLVAGLVEKAGDRLYNSAAVIDGTGRTVGIARKSFLWDCDNRWFSAGEQLSVFDTELGRMGVMICADGRAPEIAATLAAKGAEFIVMPTAWVNAAKGTGRFENPQADFLIRARAREFAVPFACADKSGREADAMEYVGQSQIVDASGNVTAIAPIDGEHIVAGELTPRRARPATVSEHAREILHRPWRPIPIGTQSPIVAIDPSMSATAIETVVRQAGGRAIRLATSELMSFVHARCAALEHAQILIVEDESNGNSCVTEDVIPRARAMENRVFVVVVDGQGVVSLVEPTGSVFWNRYSGESSVRPLLLVNLALANNKNVTPETHIWEQRRVESFAF